MIFSFFFLDHIMTREPSSIITLILLSYQFLMTSSCLTLHQSVFASSAVGTARQKPGPHPAGAVNTSRQCNAAPPPTAYRAADWGRHGAPRTQASSAPVTSDPGPVRWRCSPASRSDPVTWWPGRLLLWPCTRRGLRPTPNCRQRPINQLYVQFPRWVYTVRCT